VSDDYSAIITDLDGNVSVSDSQSTATVTSNVLVAGGATYIHTQASASSSWVINHGLSRRPSVTIVDSAGNVQIGEVLYTSDNSITVTFASAFGGYAYIN
jgi:hypothetical protein